MICRWAGSNDRTNATVSNGQTRMRGFEHLGRGTDDDNAGFLLIMPSSIAALSNDETWVRQTCFVPDHLCRIASEKYPLMAT